MFDGLGPMMKLLGNKDKIAAEAVKLRETMANIVGEGGAGGLVSVRASGTMEVLSVEFSATASAADPHSLQSAVLAATNQALLSARSQVAAETQKMAAALGLPPAMLANIPGLG